MTVTSDAYGVTDPTYQALGGDDPTATLGKILSPMSADEIVGPPPDSPPPGQPGVSTQRTGNLAMAPRQSIAKNQDTEIGRSAYNTLGNVQPAGSSGLRLDTRNADPRAPLRLDTRNANPQQPVQIANASLIQAPTSPTGSLARPSLASGASTLAPLQASRMAGYQASPAGQAALAPAPALSSSGVGASTSIGGLGPATPMVRGANVVPDKLNMQTLTDQQKLDYLKNSGSGIDQIQNTGLRRTARVGDALLSTLLPGVAPFVGGSTARHELLVGRQQGLVGNDQAQQTARANQEDIIQQTNERAQKAALDIANAAKADRFDPNSAKTVETGDGVYQLNPATGKYDIRVGAPKDKTPEGERPLGSSVPNLNKTLTDRYQVLHPGQALPDQYKLPATATQKDYERIDKALGGVEGAEGTHQQQQQTLALRQQAAAAAEAARAAGGNAALDRETARMAKPYEKANETASSQLDKIDDAANMISGNAEAQALGIPKVLTALVGGQGTGVRITTPELNAIATARGWSGNFEGTLNSISGKGKLTSTQQQQLKQILNDVKARITQKRQIANDALDKINGASGREAVIAADKEARQKMTDLESGKPGGSSKAAHSGGFNWEDHPLVKP